MILALLMLQYCLNLSGITGSAPSAFNLLVERSNSASESGSVSRCCESHFNPFVDGPCSGECVRDNVCSLLLCGSNHDLASSGPCARIVKNPDREFSSVLCGVARSLGSCPCTVAKESFGFGSYDDGEQQNRCKCAFNHGPSVAALALEGKA